SPCDRGGFMQVSEQASMSRGGMKNANHYNTLVPPVYDVLGSNAALATWNAETFEHALLEPVEVCMKKKHERNQTEIEHIVKQVKQDYENYMNELSQVSLRENAEAGSALFFSRDVDERLSYYGKKLQENPDDYVSMSYYGAALAMKGGESSVFKAISLVNEAYKYLDAASRLAFGKDGEIDVLMNRACVSASVPNHVFEKAQSGAEDFIRIANLSNDERIKAYCYVMAYECYKICGKENQAFLILQEAKKMIK
ncbi:MAG: hypothetical protein IKI31_07570, partial [Treponema sp.]|nr:hypothetical protein [Treponema sp.]